MAAEFLGNYTRDAGLSIFDIENRKLPKPVVISNGIVKEIRSFSHSDAEVAEILSSLSTDFKNCKLDSLRKKVHVICNKIKELKKKGQKQKTQEYCNEEFLPPKVHFEHMATSVLSEVQSAVVEKIKVKVKDVVMENRGLKRDIEEGSTEINSLTNEIEILERKLNVSLNVLSNVQNVYRKTIKDHAKEYKVLEKETIKLQKQHDDVSKTLDETTNKLQQAKEKLSRYNTRNLNKRQKRLKVKNLELETKHKEQKKEINDLREDYEREVVKNEELTEISNQSEKNVKSLKDEKHKLQKKISVLKMKNKQGKCETMIANDIEIENLKQTVEEHRLRISELENINSLLDSESISTFEDGRYTNEIRETIMSLVTECNVSISKVNSVIETVLKNLTGRLPERLPSMAVRSRLFVEAKAVAHQQIVQAMLTDSNPEQFVGNTLHSDATSKFFRHYQSYQVTLASGKSLSIGLTELGGSDAQTIFQSFRQQIDDLAVTVSSNADEKSDLVGKLVASITNTMSDQGSINPILNSLISEMRANLLPHVYENWDHLDEKTQGHLRTMGHFFCKMHLVVNFANECDKALKVFENNVVETGRNPHSFGNQESGAARLVRTAAKAFTSHGSEKAGVTSYWESYLDEKNEKNHLVTYRSNRFNILFYDSAALYYHCDHVKDFLEQWLSPNELLKSIDYDINQKLYLAEIRALGIVDKIITGPMWRLFEKEGSILSLNPYLERAINKLQQWATDAAPIMEGDQLFLDLDVHKDDMYQCLFADTDPELDTLTQMALEILINSILIILDRQAKDQLPGGKYFEPNENLKKQSLSVPKTNTISERDFGSLDYLLRSKPSSTVTCLESIILWSNNKTTRWLDSLSADEKCTVLDSARNKAPQLKKMYEQKKLKIKEQKLKKLKEKQDKKTKKEEKSRVVKIDLTNTVTDLGGVWVSSKQVDDKVSELRNSGEKVFDSVYTQIKFQKDVLNSVGPRELFQKTRKGKEYSENELISNLKQIIQINVSSSSSEQSEKSLIVKSIGHVKSHVDEYRASVSIKINEARQKRVAIQQKELLPKFLNSPEDLVGKKIKHQCKDENGKPQWYHAKVLKLASKRAPKDFLKINYVIVYDESSEDEWTFDLLTDLKRGDLIIEDCQ